MNNSFLSDQRNDVNHLNYYYFDNAFTKEEIDRIKGVGDSRAKHPATILANQTTESHHRKSDIVWLGEEPDTIWLYEKIAQLVKEANTTMKWNFDIWGFGDKFQYTVYKDNGGHYGWHLDLGPGASNRKISIVVQLSDPSEYEGGDLEINNGTITTVPKQLGLICLFPSFLLHQVTPITSGTRKSLVTWVCGANFK
tara:strand:- start:358 stop:945 length:588 start_codon:yes stop_codon:yes gene_type:complete